MQLIVERGEQAFDALPKALRENREAMAETIENNVRRLIIDEMAVNPKYYERMSQLLDVLIKQRRQDALAYKAYLAKIVDLTRQVKRPATQSYPHPINSPARRALYDNLGAVPNLDAVVSREVRVADDPASLAETTALAVDDAIRRVKKSGWRGNRFKEREVRHAIKAVLHDDALVESIFEIVKAQRDY